MSYDDDWSSPVSSRAPMQPNLFFVLGAPKSGTTWLQYLLNAHPNISCRGEGLFHRFGKNSNGCLLSTINFLNAAEPGLKHSRR